MSLNNPSPPSPQQGLALGEQAGQQQQGFNISSQAGSEIGQNIAGLGGFGYQQTGTGPGGVPLYTASTYLSPAEQAIQGQQQMQQLLFGGAAGALTAGALPTAGNPTGTIMANTGGITSGILGNEVSYLEPFFNMQTNQEETQLANQGFTPGTTPGSQGSAWYNAMLPLDTSQGLTVANFLANAQPQAFQEAAGLYQLPYNLASSLYGNMAPTYPGGQYVQTPQLGSVNEIGAIQTEQEALQAQYNAQLAQQQSMMAGLFGIGSAGLGALGQYGGLANAATILAA